MSLSTKRDSPTVELQAHVLKPEMPTSYPHLNQPDILQLSDLIVQSFVPRAERDMVLQKSDHSEPRICGSWVEVLSHLPGLRFPDSVLSTAVTALATSILSRLEVGNFNCSDSYQAALSLLRQRLGANRLGDDIELLSTVMCLTMVEVLVSRHPNYTVRY